MSGSGRLSNAATALAFAGCVASLAGAALAQDSSGGMASGAVSGTEGTENESGQLRGAYTAFLGDSDHYNSRGQRLTSSWQIVRQDRANFHRFGVRDPGDEDDPFFASVDARARMERMLAIDPQAERRIVGENVLIRVEVYDDVVRVTLF